EAKQRLGLDSPIPSRQAQKLATVHRFALTKAKQAYNDWQRATLIDLTDEYRELSEELEIAEIAYRQIRRRPDLYTLDDAMWWVGRLYTIRGRLAALEHDLDIL